MVAAKKWVEEAALILEEEVGRQKARRIVMRFQKIPAPNNSVRDTLVRLRNALHA